jgi:hypothetical protein
MANLRVPKALLDESLGYAPEELAHVETELARLNLGDLVGTLLRAREELAREAYGA